jgi:hypothetical protein
MGCAFVILVIEAMMVAFDRIIFFSVRTRTTHRTWCQKGAIGTSE